MKKNRCCNDVKSLFYQILRKMKLTLLLLFVTVLTGIAADSYSQSTKLTLKLENVRIEDLLNKIEDQSQFRFFYNEEINLDKKVSIDVSTENISNILEKIFADKSVHYEIIGRQIILSNRIDSNNISGQPQKSISGKVTDSSGAPLPGVSVVVKGTTTGVITDMDGKYTLPKVPDNATLVFSFVGMKTQQFPLVGKTTLNVVMLEESVAVDDVVVVGYGTQKKVNLTGSVASINSEKLSGSPSGNSIASLQGRLPGVTITQTSGRPGYENTNILIRGIGTMNNSSPMILVDGVESKMSDIAIGDIENVSILKDAASASIYGTRAANGVIIVTTKRGVLGTPKISYSSWYGFQKPTGLPDHLSSADFASLMNEGLINEGKTAQYSSNDIKKFASGEDPYSYPNTDWLGQIVKGSGFTQNQNLSIAGGNEASRYRTTCEYLNQDGLVKNTNRERFNGRINLDSKVNNWFTMGMNASLSRDNLTSPAFPYSSGSVDMLFRTANRISPTVPVKFKDGSWNKVVDGNPVAWIEEGGEMTSIISHLMGSAFGEIKIFNGLTLKGIAGINYNQQNDKTHIRTIQYSGSVQGPNSVTDQETRNYTITLQSYMNYDQRFGKQGIKVLLGASRENSVWNGLSGYRKDFPSNELAELNAGSTVGWTNSGWAGDSKIASYFGRINYDYNNKYLFEANIRRDASSKFAPDKRIGYFPSFSAGWRLAEESFMKEITWINNLKLRASWGKLGNHNIDDYTYLSTISLGQNYTFGGVVSSGAAVTTASNPIITWEKTTETDFGIDADLFQNKINLIVDYYNRYTDDILVSIPVSQVFGLPAPVVNGGAMRNKGIEFQLGYNNSIEKLKYNISMNFAYNRNNVEKFPNPSKGNYVQMEGCSWNSFYGYECIGKFQTDDDAKLLPHQTGIVPVAGDLRFKDQNKDGKIDANDRVVLGNTIPKYTFGANIDLKYKNFDFTAFFQGAAGVNRQLSPELFWPLYQSSIALKMHLDRTIVENGKIIKEGYYPRILPNLTYNNVMSSFVVLNASYLRMKNIQIGYSIPVSIIKYANFISKARIYFSGQNLFTITNFPSESDPEVDNGGGINSYPQVKFYTLGIDITF